MPDILFGTAAYKKANGNLPEIRLVNMYVETAATSDQGAVILSRQGFTPLVSGGTGPVTGIFSEENVFDGDLFWVSDERLYREGVDVGGVVGTEVVSFAGGTPDQILVCAGGEIFSYDGSSVSVIDFPDDDDVAAIVYHDGRYIAAVANSNRWYWSDAGDGLTWDPLSFASAEAKPDTLLDIKILGDNLFLLGSETVERWSNGGTDDIPYSRIEGAVIEEGIIGTGCSAIVDALLFTVSRSGVVYKFSEQIARVSDHGIEEKIKDSTSVRAFGFAHEGHSFFWIKLDAGSFLYDNTSGEWCEFKSYGRDNWRASCACMQDDLPVFGDEETGQLWILDGWDDNDGPLERLFTALFPVKGGVVIVDSLLANVNTGWTDVLADQGANPILEMRASRDAGATWGEWRPTSLGSMGAYRVRSRWTRCGMFDFPGGMFEIRTTDPVPFRVSEMLVNEAGGGRSR